MAGIHSLKLVILFCAAIALAGFAPRATADDEDPPSRVARLAYAQGSVSFQPAGTDDWVTAGLNRPVTTGDKLWSDNGGRIELQLDGSLIRLSTNTGVSFLNLSNNVTQIQLSVGTLLLRVRRLDETETYEIDTPNLAFTVLRPGVYRIAVNEAGDSTVIKIRSGQGEVTGGGSAYSVHANDSYTFSGIDRLDANSEGYTNDEDQFDTWAANRDRHWENSSSARYVSADVVGYEDLDDHGTWRRTSDYGNVWFPRTSVQDWAPYHYGHWDYIEPWGYTWVDNEPWGFAPFHYGRWVSYEGSWGWVPAPPRIQGAVYVRPVYAPALVAWIGGPGFAIGIGIGGGDRYASGVNVGWFPLGPREVYVPSYRVSRNYVNNVNVSNTRVDSTVVNNYYNTTVVNNNVNVTNVRYVNQSVPGAVAATTPHAFTSAQPVARNAVRIDRREVASAPVRAFTPAVVPAKQAVLGTGAPSARPPSALQTRPVVAKTAPPPPPPTFERRQEAIKSNGGRPLSVAQIQQIQPVAARREAPVRIAPAAQPVTPPQSQMIRRGQQTQNERPAQVAPNADNKAVQPPNRPVDRPTERPVNPNNAPQPTQGQANRPPTTDNPPREVAPNETRRADRPGNRPADRPVPADNAKPTENKPVAPDGVQPTNRPADRQTERPANPNETPQPRQGQANRPPATDNPPQAVAPDAPRRADRPGNRPADRPVPPENARPTENKPPDAVQPGNRPADRPTERPVNPNEAPQPRQGQANRPPASDNPPREVAPNENRRADRPGNRPADRPVPPENARPTENKPIAPDAVQPTNRPADRPTERPANPNNAPPPAQPNRPDPPSVRPSESPAPARPNVQPPANAELDRKHQQEQDQLRVKQEQDRQRVQQQQEQDRAKAAPPQADPAKKQQVEQQQKQQTQQLQQKHADEQKALDEKQQKEKKPPPKPKKDEPPPAEKP
jgi:hypothetical protein